MDDILAKMAEEADDGPSDNQLRQLREYCGELVRMQSRARELEKELKETKKKIWDMEMKTIPDYATEIGVDRVGLPDFGADVTIAPYYKANISADWPEERRAEAFAYLERIGVGDIVRTSVEFTLGRDSLDLAKRIAEEVRQRLGNEVPPPQISMKVPWNTLTSTVKELTERGDPLDLEMIGATVGQRAVVKERKE